jgi:hypothetical protein
MPGFAGDRDAGDPKRGAGVLFPDLSDARHETAGNIFAASVIFR